MEIVFLQAGDKAARCGHCGTTRDLPDPEAAVTEEIQREEVVEETHGAVRRVRKVVTVKKTTRSSSTTTSTDPSGDVADVLRQMGFPDPFSAEGRTTVKTRSSRRFIFTPDGQRVDLKDVSPELEAFLRERMEGPPPPDPLPIKKSLWKKIFGKEK